MINVLVTGAGSGVGQGIVKALNISSLELNIISADINKLNATLFRTKKSLIIPKVESEGAKDELIKILKNNNISVLLIGSEYEIDFFSKNKKEIENNTGTMICISDSTSVEISNDKWLTAEFFRKNNIPHTQSIIPTHLSSAIEGIKKLGGYPCILKTRSGTSNRHVHVIRDQDHLEAVFHSVPKPVLQELLDMPSNELNNEYTCSVFKCVDGTILGPFTAKRTLRAGSSWMIEVDHFEEIYPLMFKIGQSMNFIGSLNVQLMMTKRGPIPFEINCRFSGTTAVRAHFGFNEPEMYIRNYFLKELLKQPSIRKGVTLRYLEEVFIDEVNTNSINIERNKGIVEKWF